MDLSKLNFEIIHKFFDPYTWSLAKDVCRDVGVLNKYCNFDGKRCSLQNRYFITKRSPLHYIELAQYIDSKYNVDNNAMRIEVCNDINGFWLKPHNDHPERIRSFVIYVDGYGPGTTFYHNNEKYTVQWFGNAAVHFKTNGLNTFDTKDISHGVEKQKISGIRSTIIVSFIDIKNWDDYDSLY